MERNKKLVLGSAAQIAIGFLGAILLGTLLLMMPMATQPGHRLGFLEALFEATSAVCVTGLVVVDTATTFTAFGRTVLIVLIQAGGMGIAVLGGLAIMILLGRVGLNERMLLRDSWNADVSSGMVGMLKIVLRITFFSEAIGALLSLPVFLRQYPLWKAVRYSIFHSISAFNNAGFDLTGGFRSLTVYADDIYMNLVTAGIIIVSGLGYLVITEILSRKPVRHYSLQTKIVLSTTAVLILGGMLLIKITERCTWLEAFFQSVTARTAGFNTIDLGSMSTAGQLVMVLLMICGASPGSTGGGVKTTTIFVLALVLHSYMHNNTPEAFRRRIPEATIRKAFTVVAFSVSMLMVSTLLMCYFEPEYSFMAILFEVTSAINTVGVSTGITAEFGTAARIVLILTMFVGRLGPITAATMWANHSKKQYTYSEEQILIG